MRRPGEDVLNRARFNDLARLHDMDRVAELRHERDVMADEDERGTALRLQPPQ